MASPVDYSLSVSIVLTKGTKAAHDLAQQSKGGQRLSLGVLEKGEYIRFMMMLYHVYEAFERALEQHAAHPVLAPTYNPGLFSRSESIAADVSFLLEVPEDEWQQHPMYTALMASPPPVLTQYVGRIEELAASADPSRILAHAYVRYLGDLFGGQTIRWNIVKAYGLEDPYGVSFYDFRPLAGGTAVPGSATIGEMKRIVEWYRKGMNEGVGDDVELKAAILEEALLSFSYSTALFDDIKEPPQHASVSSMPNGLSRPAESSPGMPPPAGDAVSLSALSRSKTVFVATEQPAAEWYYRTASVVAFIAAFSIAHFVLVVGGFTGSKGYAKLDSFQQWLDELFSAHA